MLLEEMEKRPKKSFSVVSLIFKIQGVSVSHTLVTLNGCFLLISYPFLKIPNVDLLL